MGKSYSRPTEISNSAVINTVSINPTTIIKSVMVTTFIIIIVALCYFSARYFGWCRRPQANQFRDRFSAAGNSLRARFQFPVQNVYPNLHGNETTATTSVQRAANNAFNGV